jgi:spore coat polysaccharide biosynthesis protein SpsF (cytidylyltransferase family)
MTQQKLVAALACRAGGSRLYGKPLQNLENNYTILDHMIGGAKQSKAISDIVLGISEGIENLPFIDVAKKHGVSYILGDQKDVLFRLIQCCRAAAGTDVFRVTTESPFTAWEYADEAWERHVSQGNDITATEYLPEGSNFEILSLRTLERSHNEGEDKERSEFCTAYPRRLPKQFKIEILLPPEAQRRTDVRLTVDYPEDLILCRRIWEALKDKAPHIPIADIIRWVDEHPDVAGLVEPYVDTKAIWGHVAEYASVPLRRVQS